MNNKNATPMKYRAYPTIMVEIESDSPMTKRQVSELVSLHVKNCISDNPEADTSVVTDVDVSCSETAVYNL